MTIKELVNEFDKDTVITILMGAEQEVVISPKEDKVLLDVLGDIVVDHAMVNNQNRLCIFAAVDLRRAK